MSATELTYAKAPANTSAGSSRITVAQLLLRAVRRWQRHRAINQLSLLDDRQLDDIGISRNDIPRVVEGLFSSEELRAKPLRKAEPRAAGAEIAVSCSRST